MSEKVLKPIKQEDFFDNGRRVRVTLSEKNKEDITDIYLVIDSNEITKKIEKEENIHYKGYYIKNNIINHGLEDLKKIINSEISFEFCFLESVDFSNCIFNKNILLSCSHILSDFNLINSEFNEQFSCFYNSFYRKTVFIGCIFNSNANFENVSFVDNEVFFNSIRIKKEFYFSNINSEISKSIYFRSIQKRGIYSGKLIFLGSNLEKCVFLVSDLDMFNFTYNNKWKEINHRKITYDENKLPSDDDKRKENFKLIEILYRQLKCKHLDLKDYKTADAFMASEYEMSRLASRNPNWTWESLYKCISNYGMNWRRPLLIALCIVVVMTCSIYLIEYFNDYYIDCSGAHYLEHLSIWESLMINFLVPFLVKVDRIKLNCEWSYFLLYFFGLINSALLILTGFAIKRKFRT